MPRYMLDTDTCSYIMKRSSDPLLKRLQKAPINDVCISVVTKSERLFGVEMSPRRQHDETALDAFLRYMDVLDFPEEASFHYAKIRADLRKAGKMIGANDLFVAAHARTLGLILVTNNVSEFKRVRNLAIESWTV